jgi:DNA helicase-2/ATP-dependent DNA helicase PcrA
MATASDDQIEEERRLFYVALTRAKNFLSVCFPLKYYRKSRGLTDQHSYAQLTRFLPAPIVHHFQKVSLEPPSSALTPSSASPSTDIRRKIASMWT